MKKIIVALVIITTFTNTLFAWGKQGHEIVAQIAKHYLDKSVAEKVQNYLGTMSFEEAATWMDQVRRNHSYDYMKPWHYINIDYDATYVKTSEPNIINALEDAIANLDVNSYRSKEAINFNLKLIFHLIGDLHQPLHVGYGDDRGGNYVQVKFLNKKTNLHAVWDESIIQTKNITAENCIRLGDNLLAKELKNIRKIDIVAWLNESRSCLPQVYNFKNSKLTQAYVNKSALLIRQQLLKAGLRLAVILNNIFKN